MLKRALVVLLLISGLIACGHASNVFLTFDYDYTTNPACSLTIAVNCVSGFQALNGSTVLGSIANPAGATGLVTGIVSPAYPTNAYGTTSYTVITLAKDVNGVTVQSAPASVTATVTPSGVKNIKPTIGN